MMLYRRTTVSRDTRHSPRGTVDKWVGNIGTALCEKTAEVCLFCWSRALECCSLLVSQALSRQFFISLSVSLISRCCGTFYVVFCYVSLHISNTLPVCVCLCLAEIKVRERDKGKKKERNDFDLRVSQPTHTPVVVFFMCLHSFS